jgi:cyclopropane fatty-acyl-phospholipid synthase-like methyltransferase
MKNLDYSIHYSRFHDDTDEHAEMMADGISWTLRSIVPVDRTAKILDIGCGFGFALRAFRKMGFSAIKGLELSTQQAERCRKAGFDVEVCSNAKDWIASQPLKFDFVVLMDVIEHISVDEQIETLNAIYECLRHDGRLFITTPNANAILASRWRYIDYTHSSSFTEHSLYFILKNAGFTKIDIDSSKGIGAFPKKIWRKANWPLLRKWMVRWCWLQVFKAEIPWERIDEISFELNLTATATK